MAAAPIVMPPLGQSQISGWAHALHLFHEAVKTAEQSFGELSLQFAHLDWSLAPIRRRKRHARYRRGREKIRPRHRRQRRS